MQETEHTETEALPIDPKGSQNRSGRYRSISGSADITVICVDAPNILLKFERGVSVTPRGKRKYPYQTIFIDGAYSGAPFLDHVNRHYSIDHHAGCVRAFTLASCEQAAVMVFQGIPLNEGEWQLIINGFDLDSMLSSWILMNHAELSKDGKKLLEEAMPFVRTEGIIDGNGLEAGILLGIPRENRKTHEASAASLAATARLPQDAKAEASVAAMIGLLLKLDVLLLPVSCIQELSEYDEIGRIPLTKGRTAIMCRSSRGIYEAEAFYKARYGGLLGILILDQGSSHYTIRLVASFLDGDIKLLYKHLNRIDPAVKNTRDKENCWGGSSDIGGSPRSAGTELDPERILSAIEEVYGQKASPLRRLFARLIKK